MLSKLSNQDDCGEFTTSRDTAHFQKLCGSFFLFETSTALNISWRCNTAPSTPDPGGLGSRHPLDHPHQNSRARGGGLSVGTVWSGHFITRNVTFQNIEMLDTRKGIYVKVSLTVCGFVSLRVDLSHCVWICLTVCAFVSLRTAVCAPVSLYGAGLCFEGGFDIPT